MPIGQVLCLGGSLTVGDDAVTSGHRTFRGALQNALATAGLTLNFIGPNQAAATAGGSDPDHAAWVNASIDSTGSASNNLTDRLASIKSAFPSPDLIIVDPPWWDIVNAPANLASRYATYIGAIQSGAWASAKILMCTAHPASGQTAAQTGGTYPAFSTVNAQIATLRAAAPTTRFVADLAALQTTTTGGTSQTLTEQALSYAQSAPAFPSEYGALHGGGDVPNWQGGHLTTSFKGIQDFNAQWSTNPPAVGNAPGGMELADYNVSSWNGSTNRFVQSVAGITPWYWIWAQAGHGSSNACVEARNMFAAAHRIGGGWEFFFSGARTGIVGWQCQLWNGRSPVSYLADPNARSGHRSDGLTSWHAPRGNVGMEVWPLDTIPSRGVREFHGGFNRDLMANADCFWWGLQVRVGLIDPNGPDDRSSSRFVAAVGGDLFSSLGGSHYDRYGWPYNAQDGGHDAWTRINWTDWRMLSALTIGRDGTWPDTGVHPEFHWSDPGTPPPLANWSPPTPFNNVADGRAKNASWVRANPLPIPPYWEGGGGGSGGGTVSGYQTTDYWLPSNGSRLFLLVQSGADKIASIMSAAIIASGALASFTGGGIVFDPLPGLATRPNVFASVSGGKVNVEPKNWAGASAPSWTTLGLPVAVVGAAFSATLSAGGEPSPTYSIVSGAPAWLSLNSSTGALSGTPTGGETSHTIVFRATNAEGSADRTLMLSVVVGVVVTTTSLPAAQQNTTYSQTLQAAGSGPFTWTITSGSLPAGLTLSAAAGVISGVPTTVGGPTTFTVRATGPTGLYDEQVLSITVVAAGSAPVITTLTLPAATVGTAYSQTIVATGSTPRTYAVVGGSLPPGLSLNGSTGAVTGTPTLVGGYAFTVRVSNDAGSVDRQFFLNVAPSGAAVTSSPWGRWLQ